MKISEIYEKKQRSLSFEIFPPKKDSDLKNIDETLEVLCALKPDFISVTFGAGGSLNCNRTIELAKKIKYAKSKDEIDDLFSQFGKQISDIYNKRDADIRTNCSTKSEKLMDRWVPTDNEIKAIVAFADGARIKTNINAGGNKYDKKH